jgi:adenine deaminase
MAFCTDDRDPQHIAADGHVNALVRDAVAAGVAPADALVMATLNPATWHGLTELGAVAPGHRADLLVLPDLERFVPDVVLTAGRPPEPAEPAPVPEWVRHTVRTAPITLGDLRIPWEGDREARVIGIIPGQIVTHALAETPAVADGAVVADPGRDLAKIAVVERHLGTGRIGLGLVRGLGLRAGAIASTVAHDAHNIVCAGVDDGDMARAVQRLAEIGGGMVVVHERGIRAELPLPVAGLLSDAPLERVLEQTEALLAAARGLGTPLEAPFDALAFLSLSVIPELKITDRGLVDVGRFEIVPLAV